VSVKYYKILFGITYSVHELIIVHEPQCCDMS